MDALALFSSFEYPFSDFNQKNCFMLPDPVVIFCDDDITFDVEIAFAYYCLGRRVLNCGVLLYVDGFICLKSLLPFIRIHLRPSFFSLLY